MPQQNPVCFVFPDEDRQQKIIEQLKEDMDLQQYPPVSINLCYLDSFDWRLQQQGLLLVKKGAELQMQEKKSGRLISSCAVTEAIKWPDRLPAGELRERLSRILEMRALIPIVNVEVQSTMLHLLDSDEKTLLRMQLEEAVCYKPGVNEQFKLAPRVCLIPLKGYQNQLRKIAKILAQTLQKVAISSLYDEALQAIGREAGDYSSRLDFRFEPEMPAARAMRMILLHLLDNLVINIEGTRADIDSEFLHDLRVATRRTRSALTQVKKIFPPRLLEEYKAQFAWIGEFTGPTRDMDVFLLEFEKYCKLVPSRMESALQPLKEFFIQHHRDEQRALSRNLASKRFRNLISQWREDLLTESQIVPGMENATRPVFQVSQQRIWKMYRLVIKEGRAITYDSPPEEMHELRKSCKKLRYLMEFFRSLYPAKLISGQIRELKSLLDNLGDYQDYEVQALKLMDVAEQMKQEGKAPAETLMAMGVLAVALLEKQEQAHKEFASCFSHFDSTRNHRINRKLFKPQAAKKGDRA